MRQELTAKELYQMAQDYEGLLTQTAIELADHDEEQAKFVLRKLVIQRIAMNFLKTIPMDKVLHDGTGYTKEYGTYMTILNA